MWRPPQLVRHPATDETDRARAQLVHSNIGAGHTGARKFRKLLPALKWQNPDASFSMKWAATTTRDEKTQVVPRVPEQYDPPKLTLELVSGETRELNVGGLRAEQILRTVLVEFQAPEVEVEQAVQWAVQLQLPRGPTPPRQPIEDEGHGDEYYDDGNVEGLLEAGDESTAR